jgi:hypothetical protein
MNEEQRSSSEGGPTKHKTTARRVALTGLSIIVMSLALTLLLPDSYPTLKSLAKDICLLATGFTVVYCLTPPKSEGRQRP